ncbi:MAG: hypothetical protein IJE17_11610 [Clostridia bacterium]|nr:hypothetical protein [Clostridia bacterium]
MKKKCASLLAILLAAVLLLTGCYGNKDQEIESSHSLQVLLAAPYVTDEHANALKDELSTAHPELFTDAPPVSVPYVLMGDGKSDPSLMVAGVTKIAAMFSAKEIELMICDADNARRYGENGENYVPLDTLFTQAEQQELGIKAAYVPILDDEGNETGEMSAPCGVDLTENAAVIRLLGNQEYSAYVIQGQANLENAKTAIRHLLTMETPQ